MGDELLPELTNEEKQLLDDPKLYALLCRTAAYRRKHDECVRLRAENERLREENIALQKQLCNYQLAEIGTKLVEEMEDDE